MVKQGPKKYKCLRNHQVEYVVRFSSVRIVFKTHTHTKKNSSKYDCSVRIGWKVKVYKKSAVVRSFPKGVHTGSGKYGRTLNRGAEVTITHFNMFGKCGYRIHQQFSSEVHYVNKYAVCPIDEYGTKVDAELKKEMELLRKAQEEAERRKREEAERRRKAEEERARREREEAERRRKAREEFERREREEAERKKAEAERRRKMEAHKEEFWYVSQLNITLIFNVFHSYIYSPEQQHVINYEKLNLTRSNTGTERITRITVTKQVIQQIHLNVLYVSQL